MEEWDEVLTEEPDGSLLLAIEVTSGSSRDAVVALNTWRDTLQVAVRARPRKGAANKAVCDLLTATLAGTTATLALVKGDRSRRKRVRIEGASRDAVLNILRAALEG
jgi:uncharacterized protein (TIGR00251 family)